MKLTVLECVQHILSKMSSDEVNSIGDTVEAMQVALELQATYFDMIGNIEWPNQFGFIQIESSGDTARPTHMRVSDEVDHFKWLRYNNGTSSDPDYGDVAYLTPEEFVTKVATTNLGSSTTTVQDHSGVYLIIKTDKDPQFFTMFDDEYIVFDAYDSTVDDTLQESKVMAWGQTVPSFTLEDSAYPDLPSKYFPQLLAETAEACMWYLKQTQDPIDARRARRQHVRHSTHRNRATAADTVVLDFGRR